MIVRWIFCALLLVSLAARAVDQGTILADEADFRFHRAAKLYGQGKVEEALGEFLASNRLVRNRNVIFNIARCFEQLHEFNEAYRWYTEILNDEMPPADDAALHDALKRLRPSLALLQVESNPPGATVYVDRKDLGARGQTPVTLALPPGKVTAIVELPGFEPHAQTLTLATGRVGLVYPELRRIYGEMSFEGEPQGFQVRLDGDEPLKLTGGRAQVVPGAHLATISAEGFAEQQIVVEVAANELEKVTFKLLPLPPPSGALVVRANVDGALVRVDGKEAGFTPSVIDLTAGKHQVEIIAEGREPLQQEVTVRKDERSFVEAKLMLPSPKVVAAEKELTRAQDAPASITIISAEEIRGFGYTTLGEALQSVRGLYTTYDRDYQTLGVRGFSTPGVYNSRVLVLVDGHVFNESSLGQGYIGHDFDSDLSDVLRIEVVRGPGSVLYGSAAFFAVVNVVHKNPALGIHGDVGGLAGSLGENSGHAMVSAANEKSYAWARISGLRLNGDSFFVNPGDPTQVAQNVDGERSGHADFRAHSGDFTLLATYNDRRKDLPTGAFDTIFGAPGTYNRDRRGFLELQWNHKLDSGLALEARVSYDGERYNGQWQYTGTPLGDFGSDSSAEDWGTVEVRARLPAFGGHRIFAGVEVQDRWKVNLNDIVPAGTGNPFTHWSNFNDGIGAATPGVPNAEWVVSGYAGDDWTLGPRAQLDVAVRLDAYRDNFGDGFSGSNPVAVNPRVALLLQPYDAGRTKLLFGRAFRNPGFYERYSNDGGISQLAAVDLKPESVYTFELEHAHQFNDEVSVTFAGYVSRMDDVIFIGAPAGVSQYQNSPSPVHAAGFEAEARWQAGPGFLLSAWYAVAVVRQGSFLQGLEIPNSPQNTGAVRALIPIVGPLLAGSTELIYGGPRQPFGAAGQAIGESLQWNLGLSGDYTQRHYGLHYGAFVQNL
ncbi:MAG TPA: TonB-dependent receptor, partial [Myxococcales bacterium]|nr:TonB-dependent receptor [Myxococcales bacterium]